MIYASLKRILHKVDAIVYGTCRGISIVMLVLLFAILTANVLVRWVPFLYIMWFDEVVEFSFAYMVFFGAAALWRNHDHFRIDWLETKLGATRINAYLRVVIDVMSLVFFIYFFRYSLELFQRSREVTPILAFPRKALYACMPMAAFIMLGYTIRDMVVHFGLLIRLSGRTARNSNSG